MSRSALEKKFIDYTRYYQCTCRWCKKVFYHENKNSHKCEECGKLAQEELYIKIRKIIPVTDLTHSGLCDIAEKWLLRSCGFVLKELTTSSYEIPDAIGWRSTGSILVECKVSRSDFLADKHKIFRKRPEMGMGAFRFYMCPEGVIEVSDLPDKWGLVILNSKGQLKMVCGPKGNVWNDYNFRFKERNIMNEMSMMYSALRRLQVKDKMSLIYESIKEE